MQPATESELAAAIKGANGPLSIVGGGTRMLKPAGGASLETSGLSGITLYEPGALTLVARAGTTLDEIEAALEAENQRLAFEPPRLASVLGRQGKSTIGGIVAANASGPRRIQAGACRDYALGVRFVDGAGTVVKNGGRVMKNVTGYDLVKLMAGSWGTLGVLSEVGLKVMPKPETAATLSLHGLSPTDAIAAMSRALGSPFDVTGAAHLPAEAKTLVRIEGFADSVAYRTEQLSGLLRSFGEIGQADNAIWNNVRDLKPFVGTNSDIWRVSVRPSDGAAVVAALPEDADWFFDWGGGLVWVACPAGTNLRNALAAIGGHATLVRADAATHSAFGTFQPEPPAVTALSDGLRARFDPRSILNAGLMRAAA
ncbi:MAG: FAD-binding protein [Pseudomonadota bacterium]